MRKLRIFISLFTLCSSLSILAQKQISGTVTSSDDNSSIPGVSVHVKGTSIGTTTNADGKYMISVPEEAETIVFSFIGYKTQEVEISSGLSIDVVLEPELYTMNEVIVTGYGSQIKAELTGSIGKISGDQLQKVPSPTFETSLQGKTPGVFMTSTTGKLGEAFNIRIRGASSISAGLQPLYVIDGIVIQNNDIGSPDNQPLNPLMTIDPKDIESIEILKDASASAIYGSRASNGVIIITTKSGQFNQKSRLNFGYSFSLQKETHRLDLLNADEYMELFIESSENGGWYTDDGFATAEEQVRYYTYLNDGEVVNHDWQDEIFRTAAAHDIFINASGGSEKSAYFAGISYTDQENILVGNDFQRINGRLNYSNEINKYVDFTASINVVQTNLSRVADDNAFATPTQLVAQAPVTPPYLEDGEPNPNTVYFNGLLALKYNAESNRINRTISNLKVNINILPKVLKFTSLFGSDILNQRENLRQSPKTDDGQPAGNGVFRSVNMSGLALENYFTFEKDLNDVHNIKLIAGISYQENKYNRGEMGAKVFPGDDFIDLDAAAENWYFGTLNRETTFQSYFTRLNYKFVDKYLLTTSLRRDGSSRFGKDNKWGNFYSVSLGWIASRENFIQNIDVISFLKPRISYGTTGNANIPDYVSLNLVDAKPYAGMAGLYDMQLGYNKLSWENTTQIDLGLDYGFYNNRIYGEIDYYLKKTKDLLLNRSIPMSNGYKDIYENVGELENKGVEIMINGKPVVKEIIWDIGFNIAFNENTVTKLDEAFGYTVNWVEEGKPLGFFYMPEYAGVDPQNGDALYYDENGEKTNDYGMAEWKMVGNPNPKYFGGFSNNVTYKNFDLTVFFQYVGDVDVYKLDGEYMSANGDWFDNQTADQLDRWQQPGDITDIPQARLGYANGTYTSSRYISDASYIRFKDLTIGYNIPTAILQKISVQTGRLYFTAKNILTITKYDGFDPEVSSPGVDRTTTSYNAQQGIDYYSSPQAKVFTFGINVTF